MEITFKKIATVGAGILTLAAVGTLGQKTYCHFYTDAEAQVLEAKVDANRNAVASLSQSIQLDGLRRHRDSIALEIGILEGKIQDNPYDYNINEWKERLRKLKIELQQTYDKVNDIINTKGEIK